MLVSISFPVPSSPFRLFDRPACRRRRCPLIIARCIVARWRAWSVAACAWPRTGRLDVGGMIHERRTREAQRTAHLARTNAAHKGDVTRASHRRAGPAGGPWAPASARRPSERLTPGLRRRGQSARGRPLRVKHAHPTQQDSMFYSLYSITQKAPVRRSRGSTLSRSETGAGMQEHGSTGTLRSLYIAPTTDMHPPDSLIFRIERHWQPQPPP